MYLAFMSAASQYTYIRATIYTIAYFCTYFYFILFKFFHLVYNICLNKYY